MSKRTEKEMQVVRDEFEAWLNEYGGVKQADGAYEYIVSFPGLGMAELSVGAHSDDPREGIWVICRFENVEQAVKVYGNRYERNPKHLYAERLCPLTGKFNFYHRSMDTIHFITAVEAGVKHLKEAT